MSFLTTRGIYNISKGPDGIYMRPPDRPGWGWDIEVAG